eukprot:m51a1_g14266 hypothetical protein (330) ;mRNA; f:306534-307671
MTAKASVVALLLLLSAAALAGAPKSKRWGEPSATSCMAKHREDVGDECGIKSDGDHICNPTTSFCNMTTNYVGTCVPLVPTWGNCTDSNQCDQHWLSATCERGYCHSPKGSIGDLCLYSSSCMSDYCSPAMRCAEHPYLAEGGNCSGFGSVCEPGLQCVNDICIKGKGNGTECTKSEECRGFCTPNGVCIDKFVQPTGAPCIGETFCKTGLCSFTTEDRRHNRTGVCLDPPPKMRIACQDSSDCNPSGIRDYSCQCDVELQGWYCKRNWEEPDYEMEKCVQKKGWGKCEELFIKKLRHQTEDQAFYTWSAAPAAALPAAALVLSVALII